MPSKTRETSVRKHFEAQAKSCQAMGSPFTASLLETAARRLTGDTAVGQKLLTWEGTPGDDALSLRFAGGMHWLALSKADEELADLYRTHTIPGQSPETWELIERVMLRHGEALMKFIAGPPQTNEVGRSSVLYGGFLAIAHATGQPLSLREIGASAGLNLNWHRYGYAPQGIDLKWGDLDAPVVLRPKWEGPAPKLTRIEVAESLGCDLNPADHSKISLSGDPESTASDEANRLLAYVWPDQKERLERMRGALRMAIEHPPRVERQSAAEWLDKIMPDQRAGCTQVIYHSIVWQYLPSSQRLGIKAALDRTAAAATAERPLAWLRMEPSETGNCAELRLSLWPGNQDVHLADADYHGAWVRWFGRELPGR